VALVDVDDPPLLVPADEAAVEAALGMMEGAKGSTFGAEVPTSKWVRWVAAHADKLASFNAGDHPAGGNADPAEGPMLCGHALFDAHVKY
jgi:hypothetical protein